MFNLEISKRNEEAISYKKIINDYQTVKKNNNASIQIEMKQVKQQKQKMVDNMVHLTNYLSNLEDNNNKKELEMLIEEKKQLVSRLEGLVFNRDKNINKILEEIQKKDMEIEMQDEKRSLLKKMNNLLQTEHDELIHKLSLLENRLSSLENNSLPILLHEKLDTKGVVRRIVIHSNCSIFGVYTGDYCSVFDIETGTKFSEIKLKGITSISFQNDYISISNNNEIFIFKLLSFEKFEKYLKDDDEIFKGEFLLEKNHFITCHKNYLKIWNFEEDFHCIKMIKILEYGLDVSLSPLKIVTSHVNDVYIWSHQFQLENIIKTNKFITAVSINDEYILITHQSSIELFSFESQKSILIINKEYEAGCLWNKAIFSPCNQYIAVGTLYGTIIFWKLSDLSKPFYVLKSNENRITSIDWSLNSKTLIASSIDKELRVFKN